MSTYQDVQGAGANFWRENDDVTPVLENIADVYTIGDFEQSAETSDASKQDATERFKEFISVGQIDPGELEVDLTFRAKGVDSAFDGLYTDFKDGQPRTYEVRIKDAGKTKFTFKAIPIMFGTPLPRDGFVSRKVKFKLSGEIIEGVWT